MQPQDSLPRSKQLATFHFSEPNEYLLSITVNRMTRLGGHMKEESEFISLRGHSFFFLLQRVQADSGAHPVQRVPG